MTDNVIPEEEVNRRRRVNELADECATIITDLVMDFEDIVKDLRERAVEAKELLDIDAFMTEVIGRCPAGHQQLLQTLVTSPWMVHLGFKTVDEFGAKIQTVFDESHEIRKSRRSRMRETIDRLLEEAPQLPDATERVLPECQIVLKSGFKSIGVLRKSKEDMLSFMATGQSGNKVITAEYFFDYDDLETIVIARGTMPVEPKSSLFGAT